MVLYGQFRDAYNENQALIEKSVSQQGRLVTRALVPVLSDLANDDISPGAFDDALSRLSGHNMMVRVLFRPNALSSANDFYFVAASPSMTELQLAGLRQDLVQQGILGRLAPSLRQELRRGDPLPHRRKAPTRSSPRWAR